MESSTVSLKNPDKVLLRLIISRWNQWEEEIQYKGYILRSLYMILCRYGDLYRSSTTAMGFLSCAVVLRFRRMNLWFFLCFITEHTGLPFRLHFGPRMEGLPSPSPFLHVFRSLLSLMTSLVITDEKLRPRAQMSPSLNALVVPHVRQRYKRNGQTPPRVIFSARAR